MTVLSREHGQYNDITWSITESTMADFQMINKFYYIKFSTKKNLNNVFCKHHKLEKGYNCYFREYCCMSMEIAKICLISLLEEIDK